jgi:hypothetical protein
MRQSLARCSAPVSFVHSPSLADFITTTVGFKVFGTHSYLYRQTSVREGKKVRSIMEYIGGCDSPETYGKTTPRNQDLEATRSPKRMDHNDEHRRELFKKDRAAFDRLHAQDAERAKSARESKGAWAEKNMSRSEKQARAAAKDAVEAKSKETMEAIKEFNAAREAEKADTTGKGESEEEK